MTREKVPSQRGIIGGIRSKIRIFLRPWFYNNEAEQRPLDAGE